MLVKHRGEAEFDFRHHLHTSYRTAVETDVEEVLRLTRQLLRDPGTRLAAAVAGWEHPISLETFMLASIYSTWSGERHPFLPDLSDRSISEVDTRLADMALEAMKGG